MTISRAAAPASPLLLALLAASLLAMLAITAPARVHAQEKPWTFDAASEPLLGNPHDLAMDADGQRLLVSDVNNNRIAILDANTLELVGSFGEDELDQPHDVALGPDGRVYVADTGNSRIAVFVLDGIDGRLVSEYSDEISRPEGVAVDGEGRVFASGAASGNLVMFSASGAALAQAGGFRSPHDVALTADGSVWLADAGNDRMVRLSNELEIVQILEGPQFSFNGPRYMDLAPGGALVVADKYAHQVKIIDPDGKLTATLGSGNAGLGESQFKTPEGVFIRGDVAWFSDSGNNRVVRYRR